MRILHTSDWHLGKNLEGASRLEEQEQFIEDFIHIVDENCIDMVIISGDIYDSSNPPAKAEKLFYKALKGISKNGKRLTLVIAGNHDNPDRLSAASPLAYEQGVIILGKPKSYPQIGKCGAHNILNAGEGYIELELNNEKAVIITLPYPSEKRLNEVLFESIEEKDRQKSYSDKIRQIFSNLSDKYKDDTINLLVSHLFVLGGEETDSERPIQLGGSLAISASIFPEKAQYIALGHLHRPQEIKAKSRCVYAGSPLQYSKSEIGYTKGCYIVDLKAGEEPNVESISFKNYKPIEVWKCEGVQEAIKRCEENTERDVWVYLEVKTDKYISQEDIKSMKRFKKDILEIRPIIIDEDKFKEDTFCNIKEKSMKELFRDFYVKQRSTEPSEEIMDLFLSIVQEEGEEDEA
ncbi:exonuclease SbcCD subunit D [Clostridium botulinum]|uniref:Nuclease SbcCD subunit D n=1 Tax=Clostridium botulinum D str. 1873 TaxID=592027 RepID=A0A9P2G772_CLOBO|nr:MULTISPECIES: exonuclease SbcCD subunit D [Clostridium]EES91291.1 DNA repair exonuclease [Clostridium botulinum D str. 1873]MBO3441509.1 exonuclease SbcCD subunit D [Clostridium haemolyticum]MCD3244887.1 exonuclease SbcCD subunit D [Clostridium botulinum C]MCD3261553.1 exonuclease SbcCD subunit D [Clostridium botulinum C]NFV46565.1 exonuclease SbcCD subunit D [Clostridium botulinum]